MQKITIFSLVMLMTGAIDSIRNMPATALFGSSLIFFFVFAAIFFLIPVALVSAELSSVADEAGGIFHWARKAFGEKMGFLAIWLQWINTVIWFPTILSFLAGTVIYFFSPSLAANKTYLISVILGVFWLLTFINLKGLTISARISNICTVLGMLVPMVMIFGLAIAWIIKGNPWQISLSYHTIVPSFHHSQSWVSLTAIITAFLGVELSAVHVKHVANPQKTFPRALFYSVIIILSTMILGSLAIAMVLPANQINLVNGIMQAFSAFFEKYHLLWLTPIMSLLIIIGTFGNTVSWVISPAKGLLQAAEYGFLPDYFCQENKNGVASRLLITQAVLVSIVCFAFLLMPSVNSSYWLLTALSTQLYLMIYIILFAAALFLRYRTSGEMKYFHIPGGKVGLWIAVVMGLTGTLIALTVGFIPPEEIVHGGGVRYEIVFSTGLLVLMLPVLFCFAYQKRKQKNNLLVIAKVSV